MRKLLLGGILVLGATVVQAKGIDERPASYLLQVSSNLDCRSVEIKLVSTTSQSVSMLQFEDSAFAINDLEPGIYQFDTLTCIAADKQSKNLELALGALSPVELKANQAYYGGKLIVKQTEDANTQRTPDVIDNCPNVISKARGISDDECTDGVGVNTRLNKQNKIALYAPELAIADIKRVRDALQLSDNELKYLPLIAKNN